MANRPSPARSTHARSALRSTQSAMGTGACAAAPGAPAGGRRMRRTRGAAGVGVGVRERERSGVDGGVAGDMRR